MRLLSHLWVQTRLHFLLFSRMFHYYYIFICFVQVHKVVVINKLLLAVVVVVVNFAITSQYMQQSVAKCVIPRTKHICSCPLPSFNLYIYVKEIFSHDFYAFPPYWLFWLLAGMCGGCC
jgi:hypothetical protein